MVTFKNDKKFFTKECSILKMPAPKTVWISLSQHIGEPCVPLVKAGDAVKKGQIVAKSATRVSANIFSPVSGWVKGLVQNVNFKGASELHIEIDNNFSTQEMLLPLLQNFDREKIIERAKAAGIVGMGGACFPLHCKLLRKVDTLIINGAECEPYITCDYRIMLDYTERFLQGAQLLQIATCAKEVFICIEEKNPLAISLLKQKSKFQVVILKASYPQGAEKQLIYTVTGRRIPLGGLPAHFGCIVCNVHTAFSLARAVYDRKPLYERVMTVSGEAVRSPKNIWVATGTKFSEVVKFCGGMQDAVKIVCGGPMMGYAQNGLEAAVVKGTNGLLLLRENEISRIKPQPCINCARCRDACPMNLMPMYVDSYTLSDELEIAQKYGAEACMECGCCAFVCPSKRPLVLSMRLAKKLIKEKHLIS